jgi:hypothetical protein
MGVRRPDWWHYPERCGNGHEWGDAAAARDQYAALLPIEERVLGAGHPNTVVARSNLARWTQKGSDDIDIDAK